jgi:uncharacterized protein (DUF2267 family)
MSTNGLEVFDRTLQTTHIWLDELMQAIGTDRHVAWKVLSTVLHKLRDRLPVELAAHVGAQLPLLIRGAYYDQFQPARQPTRCASLDEFCAEVGEWLRDTRSLEPRLAVSSVFALLSRHLPEGQIHKVHDVLPRDIRKAWIAAAEAMPERPVRDSGANAGAGAQADREARA